MPRECPYPFGDDHEKLLELLLRHFIARNVKVILDEGWDFALIMSNMVTSGADAGNRLARSNEIESAWAEIKPLAEKVVGHLDKLGGVFSFKFYFNSEDTASRFFAAREDIRECERERIDRLPRGPPSWSFIPPKLRYPAQPGDW